MSAGGGSPDASSERRESRVERRGTAHDGRRRSTILDHALAVLAHLVFGNCGLDHSVLCLSLWPPSHTDCSHMRKRHRELNKGRLYSTEAFVERSTTTLRETVRNDASVLSEFTHQQLVIEVDSFFSFILRRCPCFSSILEGQGGAGGTVRPSPSSISFSISMLA